MSIVRGLEFYINGDLPPALWFVRLKQGNARLHLINYIKTLSSDFSTSLGYYTAVG